jgi:hypothetical protein
MINPWEVTHLSIPRHYRGKAREDPQPIFADQCMLNGHPLSYFSKYSGTYVDSLRLMMSNKGEETTATNQVK